MEIHQTVDVQGVRPVVEQFPVDFAADNKHALVGDEDDKALRTLQGLRRYCERLTSATHAWLARYLKRKNLKVHRFELSIDDDGKILAVIDVPSGTFQIR